MPARRSHLGALISGIYLLTIAFLFLNSHLCGIWWCGVALEYLTSPWISLINLIFHANFSVRDADVTRGAVTTAAAGILNTAILYVLIKKIANTKTIAKLK